MTQQEKAIKIAEACGWTRKSISSEPGSRLGSVPKIRGFIRNLLTTLQTLTVAQIWRKRCSGEQWISYCINLIRQRELLHSRLFSEVGADANQRCEAFGKTKGLWP